MEIFRRFRKPDESEIRIKELSLRHEQNIQRAKELFRKNAGNERVLEVLQEAESIFISTGSTLSDIGWIAGLRKYGLSERAIREIWDNKHEVSDKIRNIIKP